jgi:hypothetical protein
MKYYQIDHQLDTEEVGLNIYPQTDGLTGDSTFHSKNSYSIFTHHNLPEKFEPLEQIKLANSAKQTDFISTALISGNGFILSEKVKGILEQHRLVDHRFYKIPLVHRQRALDHYFWFQMYHPAQDYINFKKSVFQLRRLRRVIKDEIRFDSMEDYWEQRKYYGPGKLFRAKEIHIHPGGYDFLYIGVGKAIFLISEKLKMKMQESGITGYKTMELKHVYVED